MKKSISIILVFLMFFALLVGCGKGEGSNAFVSNRFEIISYVEGIYDQETILYDRSTGVMYVWIRAGYGGGLSPLYNADGTVMTYGG